MAILESARDSSSLQKGLTKPYHLRVLRPARRSFTETRPVIQSPAQNIEYPIELLHPTDAIGLSLHAMDETLHEGDPSPP